MTNPTTSKGLIIFILAMSFFIQNEIFAQKKQDKQFMKIYNSLEEAYDAYDYETILDYEDEIIPLTSTRSDTLASNVYSFLGEGYFYIGEYQQSTEYFDKELEILKQVYGDDIPDVEYLLDNLAIVYLEAGHYQKSEDLHREIVDLYAEKYGKKSEEYVLAVIGLGELWLTATGLSLQIRLRKAEGLPALIQNFPNISWELYGWILNKQRSAIIRVLNRPIPTSPADVASGFRFLGPVLLLRACAVECALKAMWLRQGNTLGRDGRLQKIPGSRGHELIPLTEAVGWRVSEAERVVLDRLSLWNELGRYPTPADWEKWTTQEEGLSSAEDTVQ